MCLRELEHIAQPSCQNLQRLVIQSLAVVLADEPTIDALGDLHKLALIRQGVQGSGPGHGTWIRHPAQCCPGRRGPRSRPAEPLGPRFRARTATAQTRDLPVQ